ncbi:MAG: RluA family pseudouridine synthase [Odoribacteraceae bacterium]|jgi:23S rRNA pseudouridine1911/1915/1917 synthase|nr:RluA family pseudouridine synthase [Odoribacteraceae bacterium]
MKLFPQLNHGKDKNEREFLVAKNVQLLTFLLVALDDKSRTTVKSILANRQVTINGTVVTQFDTILKPGDVVRVNMKKGSTDLVIPDIEIVHEDDDLIVIDKPHGLLSVATERERERTAYFAMSEYARHSTVDGQLFVLHRLDRDTSGLMMFAKNARAQETLQSDWGNMVTCRKYVAVVEGVPETNSALIATPLKENSAMKVYTSEDGIEALTRFDLVKTNGTYSLLDLELETGRKNQIRAHVASLGLPVAGDFKYGARTNPINRLALHARELRFIHPSTGEEMGFKTKVPRRFLLLVKKREQ